MSPFSNYYNSDKFKRYLKVQQSGQYNMITEATQAANSAGLTLEEYKDIIRNYNMYKKLYDEKINEYHEFMDS